MLKLINVAVNLSKDATAIRKDTKEINARERVVLGLLVFARYKRSDIENSNLYSRDIVGITSIKTMAIIT